MSEDLRYPSLEAVRSVLNKIGIDPDSRIDQFDQDYEYTACNASELEKYFILYHQYDTARTEKRVLGCFFLQCLNDYKQENVDEHALQERIFECIFNDYKIHQLEIEYWSCSDDPDEDNWWYITKPLLAWAKTHNK